MSDGKSPDVALEFGYDVAKSKATFTIGISNVFKRAGRHRFGFHHSKWWTKQIAKGEAKAGQPPSNSQSPDGRELDIELKREDQLLRLKDKADSAVQDAREWVDKHQPTQTLERDSVLTDVKGAVAQAMSDHVAKIRATRPDFEQVIDDYSAFRSKHGITRMASVPLVILQPFALLLAALLAETAFNAFIFAGVNEQGLIGGLFQALAVSVINVLLGLVFGFFVVRYAIVKPNPYNYILWGIGSLFVLAAIVFNFSVAHYREVAELAIIEASRSGVSLTRDAAPTLADAWPHLAQNPFAIGSFLGWGLLIIGLCIFGYATYKGYNGFTDPYPGYGHVAKKFYVARYVREDHKRKARKDGFRELRTLKSRLMTALSFHNHYEEQVGKSVLFAERLMNVAETAERRINTHAYSLLNTYRSANKRKRDKLNRRAAKREKKGKDFEYVGDAPARFDKDPRTTSTSPDKWTTIFSDLRALQSDAEAALDDIRHNKKILTVVITEVNELLANMQEFVEINIAEDDRRLFDRADAVIAESSAEKGRPAPSAQIKRVS